MKNYTPYLLYQYARFGALSIPQMQRICESKCKRSKIYGALTVLVDRRQVFPIINPRTKTRGYYATDAGRRAVFGRDFQFAGGLKAQELDHTLQCNDVLLALGQFENVTGIATAFELSQFDVKEFNPDRTPDGIVRLKRDGQECEYAVEIESTVRNRDRIAKVLNSYTIAIQCDFLCRGLLIFAGTATIFGMYLKAIHELPPDVQARIYLVKGYSSESLPVEVLGAKRTVPILICDWSRTLSMEAIEYSQGKSEFLLRTGGIESLGICVRGQQQPASELFLNV